MVTFINTKMPFHSKYVTGMYVNKRILLSVAGEMVHIPGQGPVHLQFRRFASCPVCNFHLHKMAREWPQLQSAGISEVVVFHSTEVDLNKYAADLPFHMIADPQKKLYKEFGVESSPFAIFNPFAFLPILRSVSNSFVNYLKGKQPFPPLRPVGGNLGLPADFLIDTEGKIIAFKYGKHADDQWSVEDVLRLSASYNTLKLQDASL